MKSFKSLDIRTKFVRGGSFILAAIVSFSFVPMMANAAQVTTRSVAMSSSAVSATNVGYTLKFTSVGAAGALILDFCSDSPLIGSTCTAPTGFSASSAATSTSGFTLTSLSASRIKIAGTIAASTPITIVMTGFTNPDTAATMYARIVTFDTSSNASTNYDPTKVASAMGGAVDTGSVAMSITRTIAVSAAVLETLTFCVSGADLSLAAHASCATADATPPNLTLGEASGTVIALDPTHVSAGTVYTQLSTNAASGAIVSMKSDTQGCGGMNLQGTPGQCYIQPALNAGIAAGQARFGLKLGTASGTATVSTAGGTYQAATGSIYNSSTYALNYISGDATGITSTYGDPILDTGGAPVNNENMPLTFAASISNTTPAGRYTANMNLIATGKF